jgi:enoyl-CoA hydratase/carnithine racemase
VSAGEAKSAGLIREVREREHWHGALRDWLSGVLRGEPDALAEFKRSHREGMKWGWAHPDFSDAALAEKLAKGRSSSTAQAGIGAFFAKKATPWTISLPREWKLESLENI